MKWTAAFLFPHLVSGADAAEAIFDHLPVNEADDGVLRAAHLLRHAGVQNL